MRWKLDWDCATNELSRSSRLEISSRLFMRRWFELGWGRLQPFRLCRACLLEGSAFENTCDRPSVSLPRTTAIPDASIRVVHRRVSQPLILSVCCSRNATHTPRTRLAIRRLATFASTVPPPSPMGVSSPIGYGHPTVWRCVKSTNRVS